jgi:hypothetical protein
VVIPILESLRAEPDDGPLVFDDPDLLGLALSDAEDARLHWVRVLELGFCQNPPHCVHPCGCFAWILESDPNTRFPPVFHHHKTLQPL